VIQHLKEIKGSIQKIAPFAADYQNLLDRIVSSIIELDDISEELNRSSDKLINDPESYRYSIKTAIDLHVAKKKHQVATLEELIEVQSNLENSVLELGNIEEEIANLTLSIQEKTNALDELAVLIHNNRTTAIPLLSEQLIAILATLGMPNVRFNIQVTSAATYYNNGKDELQFLFSANKGTDFGLLKKVASGGEMSRIMLAVKLFWPDIQNYLR
jgi:DNA repair protein RecN (Recombination protein N)